MVPYEVFPEWESICPDPPPVGGELTPIAFVKTPVMLNNLAKYVSDDFLFIITYEPAGRGFRAALPSALLVFAPLPPRAL